MIFGIRIITDDIDRLVEFYERLTGVQASRPTPFFAELRLETGLLAFASPATVAMLGEHAPHPTDNRSVLLEFLVDDADNAFQALREHLADIVQEPTTMPWGNRSAVFLDPDGNTVNLFSRPKS
ncbi:VOC family protein [Nocardioides mangrovicus]|uniref:VOC family protein n=1 Tax=Nocardioides mangrovicus TaxID=2478913 RepID=A0A3L8P4Z0_9ACTN|nr:VOC family protein [Nocardioides mangrovicus]RLV49823.1 VOC family protein [Nocardioides mangrovicus]